jgi:hypothetical protein
MCQCSCPAVPDDAAVIDDLLELGRGRTALSGCKVGLPAAFSLQQGRSSGLGGSGLRCREAMYIISRLVNADEAVGITNENPGTGPESDGGSARRDLRNVTVTSTNQMQCFGFVSRLPPVATSVYPSVSAYQGTTKSCPDTKHYHGEGR